MLKTCSSVLLLTKRREVAESIREVAVDCGFRLQVESEWRKLYRADAQLILCDSCFVERINGIYLPSVTVILSRGESFLPFKDKVRGFVFDYSDARQLYYAVLVEQEDSKEEKEAVFLSRHCSFDFGRDRFLLDGKGIYLTAGEKKYLHDWLVKGSKDNSRRIHMFNMRQRFGKGFLADVDRHGNIKG